MHNCHVSLEEIDKSNLLGVGLYKISLTWLAQILSHVLFVSFASTNQNNKLYIWFSVGHNIHRPPR
jgi:hypothetical protein